MYCIFYICANARELDFSGLKVAAASRVFYAIDWSCYNLRRLTWDNSDSHVSLHCGELSFLWIKALFVDDSCFGPVSLSADANGQLLEQPTSAGLEEYYLMMNCIGLQWLNINNVSGRESSGKVSCTSRNGHQNGSKPSYSAMVAK
jgi:hypothetical protein